MRAGNLLAKVSDGKLPFRQSNNCKPVFELGLHPIVAA